MKLDITDITKEDDPAFVQVVASILDSVVSESAPEIIAVIKIDNWFDHKWLNFSGKVAGALGIWKKELTIPPFNPNRVKSQMVYRLANGGKYVQIETPPLHIAQPSSENLKRTFKNNTSSGLFAWWSSNTVDNGKGSLMVYTHVDSDPSSWYASFDRDPEWEINKTKGIPSEILKRLMERRHPAQYNSE